MRLLALTAGYVLFLRHFNVSELSNERHFGAADRVAPAGEVYLEPLTSPAETTLSGSLAAIVFALPVLRNALPGSPPLGVEADMWVFL